MYFYPELWHIISSYKTRDVEDRTSVVVRSASSEVLLQAVLLFALLAPTVLGTNMLLTNDDGWAVVAITQLLRSLTQH
jgi:hypothetical protein